MKIDWLWNYYHSHEIDGGVLYSNVTGAAPYSPSQEDEPMEDDDDDEAYDPTQPLETESKPSTDKSSNHNNPLDTEIKVCV